MGYYTSHKLEIVNGDNGYTDYEEEISVVSGYSHPLDGSCKWYDHEEHMREYSSLKYPKIARQIKNIKILVFALISTALSGCGYFFGTVVEQEISPNVINSTEMQLKTYVYQRGIIIWSSYDNADSLSESIVKRRQQQADSVVNILNKLR